MKKKLSEHMEGRRVAGGANSGPYGHFAVWCPVTRGPLFIVVSDGRDWQAEGLPGVAWEHASISAKDRCPTWQEMTWVKHQLWEDHECVIQFHPPSENYVNIHPFVLHLWKPVGIAIPMPPIKCI